MLGAPTIMLGAPSISLKNMGHNVRMQDAITGHFLLFFVAIWIKGDKLLSRKFWRNVVGNYYIKYC